MLHILLLHGEFLPGCCRPYSLSPGLLHGECLQQPSLYQEQGCQKMQKTDGDDCMSRSGMSYDEYQREMKREGKEK